MIGCMLKTHKITKTRLLEYKINYTFVAEALFSALFSVVSFVSPASFLTDSSNSAGSIKRFAPNGGGPKIVSTSS